MPSGTVASGMKISAIANGAFIDWGVPWSLTPYVNWRLNVKDSAGKRISGYVKAAGVTQTLAAAKNLTGITKANPGVVTYAAGHGYANGNLIYFSGLTEMLSLNGKYKTLAGNVGDTFTLGDLSAATAAETTGGACSQLVSAVGPTGVTISSTLGGATQSWQYKETGFNFNDTSYTYELLRVVASGSVSLANTRLSIVNGTAFVDFSAAGTLVPYLGLRLDVFDSAKLMLSGIAGAAGTGETYSANPYATFDLTSGWTADASTIDSANHWTNTAASGGVHPTVNPMGIGKLYKCSITGVPSAGTLRAQGSGAYPVYATNGAGNAYGTAVNGYLYVQTVAGGIGSTTTLNTLVVQQVLTPSLTGITILNALGGAQSWTSEQTGFARNDASGYTYEIYEGLSSGGSRINSPANITNVAAVS